MALALTTIIPKVIIFCPDFAWRYDKFVIRDASWVDLSNHPEQLHPYFYSNCLIAGWKNTKVPVFKTKQFSLYVVIPALQWKEYEEHVLNLEEAVMTMTLNKSTEDHCLASPPHNALEPVATLTRHEWPSPAASARDQNLVSFTSSVAEHPLSFDVMARSNPKPTEPLFIKTAGLCTVSVPFTI